MLSKTFYIFVLNITQICSPVMKNLQRIPDLDIQQLYTHTDKNSFAKSKSPLAKIIENQKTINQCVTIKIND